MRSNAALLALLATPVLQHHHLLHLSPPGVHSRGIELGKRRSCLPILHIKAEGSGASAVEEEVKGTWAVIDESFHIYDEINEINEDEDYYPRIL